MRGKPPLAWLVDDTGFPKQGKHSVFVQRQYSGTLGKVGNCQIGVSLSVCTEDQSLPLDFELYMPEKWAKDRARRKACKVPAGLKFRTKPEIALELIERALLDGVATRERGPRRAVRLRDGGAAPARRHPACNLSAGAVLAGGARPPPRNILRAHTAADPLPPSHLKSPPQKRLGRRGDGPRCRTTSPTSRS